MGDRRLSCEGDTVAWISSRASWRTFQANLHFLSEDRKAYEPLKGNPSWFVFDPCEVGASMRDGG